MKNCSTPTGMTSCGANYGLGAQEMWRNFMFAAHWNAERHAEPPWHALPPLPNICYLFEAFCILCKAGTCPCQISAIHSRHFAFYACPALAPPPWQWHSQTTRNLQYFPAMQRFPLSTYSTPSLACYIWNSHATSTERDAECGFIQPFKSLTRSMHVHTTSRGKSFIMRGEQSRGLSYKSLRFNRSEVSYGSLRKGCMKRRKLCWNYGVP